MIRQLSSEHKIYFCTAVVLSLFSIFPIWVVDYFPSQNGPSFLNIIHIFNEIDNPEYAYKDYFFRHLHYMPYLSMYGLLYLLNLVFPLFAANKIMLSIMVLFFPLTIFYFLIKIDHSKIIFAFPAYLIIYNYGFMRGYYNFFIAIMCLIIFITKWYEFKELLNFKKIVVLNLLLLSVFISHLIVTVFLLFIVCFVLLLEGKPIKDIALHLIKISIPVFFSMAYFAWFTFSNSIWNQDANVIKDWWFKTENIYLRFLWPYSHFGKLVAVIPFLIILFTLMRHKGDFSIRYIKKKRISIANSNENRNILLLCVIILLYYLFPWKFMGWHKADVHLIVFLFVFFLACPRVFKDRKSRLSFVMLNCFLSIIFFCHAGNQIMVLNQEIKTEYLAGLEYMDKNSKMLPVTAGANPYDVVNPYAHLFEYYTLHKGIITGKSLAAYNTISPVWYKNYMDSPNFPGFPIFTGSDTEKGNIDIIREAYDYVLIWGNNERMEQMFLNNGFRLVFEKQRLHIFEPEQAQGYKITMDITSRQTVLCAASADL